MWCWRNMGLSPTVRPPLVTLSVLCRNHRLDVAAHVEVTDYPHPVRIQKPHQIIQYAVHCLLVRDVDVSEAVHIELETLEFHNGSPRLIADAKSSEVRVPRPRAYTGELRSTERHRIAAVR